MVLEKCHNSMNMTSLELKQKTVHCTQNQRSQNILAKDLQYLYEYNPIIVELKKRGFLCILRLDVFLLLIYPLMELLNLTTIPNQIGTDVSRRKSQKSE